MEFALLGGIVLLYRMHHGSHGSDISGKPMSLEQIVDFIAEDSAMVDDLRPEIRNQVGLMRTLIQATVNCTQLGSMMGTLPLCGFGPPLCGFGPLLTNLFSGCIIRTISYAVQVPPALLGIWRRIVNPVRIRNGTATVCEEAPHGMKVRHWDYFLRRQCGKLMIRESGDLLEQVARVFCVILQWALCLLWKNGHGSVMLPWLFVFTGGLLIAVCGPYLCFSANRQIACPVPVSPFGNRGKGKSMVPDWRKADEKSCCADIGSDPADRLLCRSIVFGSLRSGGKRAPRSDMGIQYGIGIRHAVRRGLL